MITDSMKARFDREVAKYPADGKQSAVIACLAIVQQEQGHVSKDAEKDVAEHLGMPLIAVHEVTTFYNMFNQRPVGRYKLNVCTNLPCQLRDGSKALRHLEQRLAIAMNETTPDGLFTLQQSECLGACADAPVMCHINPQIFAGLDGTNWRLKEYEARDGYKALRRSSPRASRRNR